MTIHTHAPRFVVIGAGIVGLAHAVAALDAGYRVTVIEQDATAVLASVRNFGHVGTSVQAGELGELAREANAIWLSLAQRTGLDARRSGTLVVATTPTEEAVLHEVMSDRAPNGAQLLTSNQAAEQLGLGSGAQGRGTRILSALLLPGDLTADPRTAVARIAAWVNAHERGEVRFGTTVRGIDTGVVDTNRGRFEADHTVVAAGHLVGRLFPELAERGGVVECALQMSRVRAPHRMGIGPAVLTGTSMLRYGLFEGAASVKLRAELSVTRPELLEIDANVMFTQQADGTLLVGDSHANFDTAPPFQDEHCSQILLGEVAALLGAERLEVLERWQGLYATSQRQDILCEEPLPGVTAVTVTTGTGMTVGLALGARTVAALESGEGTAHEFATETTNLTS
ncbi:TIGR03364 family FAD-dependent oxidoreductase [Leucobacter coleopterorum]|uniref:TIGR03364 family FAD-dependent oxidoreductase n=1 Tax=Leucobacter coleopterorum TaxID=2714933 RepID=A0ABX6JUY4_9MICO|nr:TIGR03364 family FAD-dependent oxidoreductase [Leucobacter coleopterorum]QIM18033.1 TIGR03364 family FAD-dependent oxidoreductase [Leucobacter coleopterorum]